MRPHRGLTVFPLAALVAAAGIGGCRDEAASGPRITGIQIAKRAPQDPEVTGTDPTGAPQDTTLDVEVSGSGFDNGSTVQLTLSGVPTEKVRTNSIRYRNSRTLIANITIAADAQVDLYDVEVTTSSRKKGVHRRRERGDGRVQAAGIRATGGLLRRRSDAGLRLGAATRAG
jgi:hypothetical protein